MSGSGRDGTRLRLGILGVVVLSLFATMLARLWYLQVLVGPELRVEAQENSVRLIYTEANRGRILDRQGRVLVDNRIVPTVVVERNVKPEVLARLADELGKDVKDFERRLDDVRFSQFKPVPVMEDVPKEPQRDMKFVFVEDVRQVFKEALVPHADPAELTAGVEVATQVFKETLAPQAQAQEKG